MATLKVTNIKNESFAGDQLYLKTDGKIGIGTTSPARELHLVTAGNNAIRIEGGASHTCQLLFTPASGTEHQGRIGYYHADNHMDFYTAANERMRIDSSGSLLIGASSSSGTTEKLRIENDANTSDVCQVTIISGNAERAILNFGDAQDHNIGRINYDNTDNHLSLWTNNLERLRITSAGNVGIGTTSPGRLLSIVNSSGAIAEITTNTSGNTSALYLHEGAIGSTNNGGAILYDGANNKVAICCGTTLTTERITIERDSGDVTIGGNLKTNNLPGRNLIINGAMQVAQRGTDTAKLYDYCGPDRFYFGGDGSQRSTISQANINLDTKGHSKAWRMEVTTASGSPSAGHYQMLSYRFEGQDLQQLKKGTADTQPLTLQFWVRSPKTGIHIVELVDQTNSSRHINKSYTINSANVWQKVEITFAGDTTGSITSDNARRFDLNFWLMAGSTYTSGTLQTSWGADTNANRAVGQVNCVDSTGNNFYLTGVQLEIGSTATNFEYRSYGDELTRCQRYFYRIGQDNTDGVIGGAFYYSDTQIRLPVTSHVAMRANPTIETTNSTDHFRVYAKATSVNFPTFDSSHMHWPGGVVLGATVADNNNEGSGAYVISIAGNGVVSLNSEL